MVKLNQRCNLHVCLNLVKNGRLTLLLHAVHLYSVQGQRRNLHPPRGANIVPV